MYGLPESQVKSSAGSAERRNLDCLPDSHSKPVAHRDQEAYQARSAFSHQLEDQVK